MAHFYWKAAVICQRKEIQGPNRKKKKIHPFFLNLLNLEDSVTEF